MTRRTLAVPIGTTLVALAASLAPAHLSGQAQTPPPQPAPAPVVQTPIAPAVVAQETDGGRLRIIAGRSMVLQTDFDISRVQITDDAVANFTGISPRELLLDGKKSGTVSLIVWGPARRVHYELVVEPSVTTLEQRLHELFPGEDINVSVSEGAVILSGRVTTNEVMLRAGEIAGRSMPSQTVINMLQLPGGIQSQQVQLQVRFAEVNRSAAQTLGINLFANRPEFTARSTTQSTPAPNFDDQGGTNGAFNGLIFPDFLNIFYFQRNQGFGFVLKALETSGNLESLAEPNLIAYNGQEASFLAGGEVPIPLVSGATGNVSVAYKEYGVRLNFKPTIAGDVIRLHLRPEVSTLDFANGVVLNGFQIPALQTRYAETEVELRDGQSFAIAGLLNNTDQVNRQWIPVLGQLPIIGPLFRSRGKNRSTTELLVLVTPRLTRPLNPDEVPPLPTSIRPPAGAPGTGTGRGGQGRGGGGLVDAPSGIGPGPAGRGSSRR